MSAIENHLNELYFVTGAQSPTPSEDKKTPTPEEPPKDETRPESADSRKGILRPSSRSSSRDGKRSRSPSGMLIKTSL